MQSNGVVDRCSGNPDCNGRVSSRRAPDDALEEGFRNPPDSAKPRTWWHWTNGNVTEDGITKDLEWMKRSGIGGFQLVDVAAGSGQEVEKKINFGTPEWYHAVRHSAEEAKRLGSGDVDLQLARMERGRRTMGATRTGNEEARVERNDCARATRLRS